MTKRKIYQIFGRKNKNCWKLEEFFSAYSGLSFFIFLLKLVRRDLISVILLSCKFLFIAIESMRNWFHQNITRQKVLINPVPTFLIEDVWLILIQKNWKNKKMKKWKNVKMNKWKNEKMKTIYVPKFFFQFFM